MATTDHDALTDLAANLLTDDHRTLFRELLQGTLQTLIEQELTVSIGAALQERTDSRSNQRNGHRPRVLSTPAGDVELAIPRPAAAASSPACWSPPPGRPGAVGVIMTA